MVDLEKGEFRAGKFRRSKWVVAPKPTETVPRKIFASPRGPRRLICHRIITVSFFVNQAALRVSWRAITVQSVEFLINEAVSRHIGRKV